VFGPERVKVEPDVLPVAAKKSPLHKAHDIETFLRYIQMVPTNIGYKSVYYQLVPFNPFILKLGYCTKKNKT
jgi:hypothetical protein